MLSFPNSIISFELLLIIAVGLLQKVVAQTNGDEHSQLPLSPTSDPSYIRIMYNDSTESYFRNHECSDGIWQERPPPSASCVCVKGVYAVSSGVCDEYFHILTGNEHCFRLDKFKPRKFFPLLGKYGLKGRATTAFRKDGPYFARLVSPAPNPFVPDGQRYIFRMNDPNLLSVFQQDGEASYGLKCIKGQNLGTKSAEDLAKAPVMQIATLPDCANEFWGQQPWCDKTGYFDYSWTLNIGASWNQFSKTGVQGALYNGKCASAPSLPPPPPNLDLMKSAQTEPVCDEIVNKQYRHDNKEPMQGNNSLRFDDTGMKKPYHLRPNWHLDSEHQITANEATRKVAKDLVAAAFTGKELPKFNVTEYRFLQQSKVIFMKVCPKEDIPAAAINYMLKAFRLLLLESQRLVSFVSVKDAILDKKIEEALSTCSDKATSIQFIKEDPCSDKPTSINSTDVEGTQLQINLYFNNKTDQNLTVPNDILFKTSDLNYPMELAWKLMLHSHYYCAEVFQSGYDHSTFQTRVESLLTSAPILYQWTHPGASLQVYQTLLSRYDLVDLAKKIDRCVAHAQAVSTFKQWLHRPADFISHVPKSRKKRYHFANNFWKNTAFCLTHSSQIRSQVTTYHEGLCAIAPFYYKNTD